ncbi:MAG: polysaccharide pyruvyl transferase family protein [Candidatus Electrothrix sp. AR5]|nr:polysaccharide pyruvyl transferase family protein [Candidatus Electrothrix sp. AR5]
MKLGILTLPLGTNYGGLLQAYALRTVLEKMGHEVLIIDIRRPVYELSLLMKVASFLKRSFSRWVLRRDHVMHPFIPHMTIEDRLLIAKNTNNFIKEHLDRTEPIYFFDNIYKKIEHYNFDGYIVGSDQVWRPKQTSNISTYFLDFIESQTHVRKISYAASFGAAEWEFSKEMTEQCTLLAKKFDSISVREDSASALCKKYLDANAVHVLDPTMLLEKKDYIRLLETDTKRVNRRTIFTYILDESMDKQSVIDEIATRKGLSPCDALPKHNYRDVGPDGLKECVIPPVTYWLQGIMDAEYVVTDSFHGCVFSIIFNKQFIAIGNISRGIARFTSLLKIFGLEERLIYSCNQLTNALIDQDIDYNKVSKLLRQERQASKNYLSKSLTG